MPRKTRPYRAATYPSRPKRVAPNAKSKSMSNSGSSNRKRGSRRGY